MPHKDPVKRRQYANARQNRVRQQDPKKYAAARKLMRLKNPEVYRQQCRDYYWKNRERMLKRNAEYLAKHRDAINARHRERKRLHPEKNREYNARRKARIAGCTTNPSGIAEFIKRVRSKRYIKCYYCGTKVLGNKAHIDHIKALLGKELGPHEVGNLCAACPRCNLTKQNYSLAAWTPPTKQALFPI